MGLKIPHLGISGKILAVNGLVLLLMGGTVIYLLSEVNASRDLITEQMAAVEDQDRSLDEQVSQRRAWRRQRAGNP